MTEAHTAYCFTADDFGIEISVFSSLMDGKLVVQIDGPVDAHVADSGQPIMRVYLNDGQLWEGNADGTEKYGDD